VEREVKEDDEDGDDEDEEEKDDDDDEEEEEDDEVAVVVEGEEREEERGRVAAGGERVAGGCSSVEGKIRGPKVMKMLSRSTSCSATARFSLATSASAASFVSSSRSTAP
jgi:hypothetical protein